jgi:hypothetical protein
LGEREKMCTTRSRAEPGNEYSNTIALLFHLNSIMQRLLQQCRENFGFAPRNFSWWDRLTYLRVQRPTWLHDNPDDEFRTHFSNLGKLWREGTIVWGCIVQANYIVYEDSDINSGGEVVYSLVDSHKADPDYLLSLAEEIYALKGTEPSDAGEYKIAAYLTDELTRVYGWEVPSSLSGSVRCRLSTTFLPRKHLPEKRLCSKIMPIIVSPNPPYCVTPLPERYWPEELIEWWTDNE